MQCSPLAPLSASVMPVRKSLTHSLTHSLLRLTSAAVSLSVRKSETINSSNPKIDGTDLIQEAQPSQRDRAMLRSLECIAKSLTFAQAHSK